MVCTGDSKPNVFVRQHLLLQKYTHVFGAKLLKNRVGPILQQ